MTQIGIRKTIPTLLFLVITARLDEAHKSQESENVPTSQEASPFDAEYLDRVWGGLSWKREHEMKTLNITLHLKIHPINPVAVLWEPATAIASYLEESCEENNNWVRGKKVLELGAGLGLPGLAAACLGGNVTVTDKPELLPWLQHGIDLNLKSIQNTSGEIRAEVLIWGDDEKIRSMPRQDLIIVSEAIYDISTVDDLISTMVRLSHDDTTIIVSQGVWIEGSTLEGAWTKFFHDSAEYFEFSPLPVEYDDSISFVGKVRKTSNTEEKISEISPGHTEL
ncbi:unnamed protein product [Bemisia tabaci]|uniref:Uncharacterized protein n=1 Tax=Bemisia tabaci TaxID=7038 RepID=A0A9P0CA58_BEMTA|nr:unnamed protein product [Bemisia tabaci]